MSALSETTALTGLGIIFAIVVGWLFDTLSDLQRETRTEVEMLAVEVAKLQVALQECMK